MTTAASGQPRSQRQAVTDIAGAMGLPVPEVSGMPWSVLRAIGVASAQMREVVDLRHRWDQDLVFDGSGTTEVFGLAATPWDEAVRATAGGVPVSSARG